MLYSVMELIFQAASNSAFIFCFFNLIIVIILRDLKPSTLSMANNNSGTNHKQGTHSKCLAHKNRRHPETEELSQAQEAAVVCKVETEGNDNCSNEAEEEEDELRRKVEEFIEKVNKGWKAELLSTSRLV